MTTTMDAYTYLQNSVQKTPQQPAPPSPPPGDLSLAAILANSLSITPHPPPASDSDSIRTASGPGNDTPRASGTFGNIPDVPIFTHWERRVDCSKSAVHGPLIAGIGGSSKYGAYSVALSDLYKDDEDGGDVIIYTGTGGRQKWSNTIPPKRLRVGPQTEDQSWDTYQNKALIVSFHTGKPVRVIRSSKCPSQYAPLRGFRYDGLYKVAAYWTARGRNGKKICRCRLERLPDQPPIPVRPITLRAPGRWRRESLVSYPTPKPPARVRPNQTNTPPMPSAGDTQRESGELPSVPQRQALSGTFATSSPEVASSVEVAPQPRPLPVYKWDPKKNELVRVSAFHPVQEDLETAEGDEEEHRGEDDVTLVPSEDGHASDCMDTE